jgi:KDO2-lipid IV(A) lauroyltransferase
MAKKRSPLQNKAELLAVRALIGAVGLFPLSFSMKLGKFAGKSIGNLLGKLKKTARRNLEIAMPDLPVAEREKIIDGTFESMGRQLGLVSHFHRFTKERVKDLIEVVGIEHFYKAKETGRGILFFTGHFGSWEVFNLLPPAFDEHMNILVRRIDNPLVENYVDKMRTRLGSRTLDKKQSAREMFRLLKRGEILGVLADLNAQEREGTFVDFFGVPASTTTSIARLALKTNALVMPGFAVWDETKQKYVVNLEPPVEYERTDDDEQDVKKLTQDITRVVEKYVRAYPEQWLWVHKRWNTRPKGEAGLY